MKRVLLLFMACAFAGGLSAQKATPNKAYNLYYEKELKEAKEVIDQCVEDPKYNTKASTWLYKANIYFYLGSKEYADKQQDESYGIQYPSAPTEAFDAFRKAQELKSNVEAFEMLTPVEGLASLYPLLLVEGVEYLIVEELEKARNTLEKAVYSYELMPPKHPFKGEIYYYYAYALEKLGQKEEAMANYQKAMADQSENAMVYVRLIELLKESGRSAEIGSVLAMGKERMPDNPNLYVAEVDYYWSIDSAKANLLLEMLPSSLYTNTDAMVNISNVYIKKGDFRKADELLTDANRRSPDNYVILFNLGYCKLKIYDQLNDQANAAILKDKAEGDRLFALANTYLDEAQILFETTLRFTPNDLAILRQLREIYYKKNSPLYDETNKKIEILEKQ